MHSRASNTKRLGKLNDTFLDWFVIISYFFQRKEYIVECIPSTLQYFSECVVSFRFDALLIIKNPCVFQQLIIVISYLQDRSQQLSQTITKTFDYFRNYKNNLNYCLNLKLVSGLKNLLFFHSTNKTQSWQRDPKENTSRRMPLISVIFTV